MRVLVVHATAAPAAGSRSERWCHLAGQLARRGHAVTVLRATLPEGYPARDSALEQRLLDAGARVVTIDGGWVPRWRYPLRPRSLVSRLKRLRAELEWPDCWSAFTLAAGRFIDEHAGAFDAVVTPAQPWSGLLAGYEAARKHGLCWIADYGDPWGLQLRRGRWRPTLDARVEARILPLAAAVVVTTEATRRLFEEFFHVPRERLSVIPAGIEWRCAGKPDPALPLTIIQAGTVYGPRVSILPFLDAVRDARARHAGNLRLVWYGEVSRHNEAAQLREVADFFQPRGSSEEISAAESSAHVHLILGNHGGVQVPGKLWRVLGTGRIPLVVTETDTDPLRELPELRESAVFSTNQAHAIRSALEIVRDRSRAWEWNRAGLGTSGPTWEDRGSAFEAVLTADAPSPSAPFPPAGRLRSVALGYGAVALLRRLIR